MVPCALLVDNPPKMSSGRRSAVFTKTNMGRMINATGLCRQCCKRHDGLFSSSTGHQSTMGSLILRSYLAVILWCHTADRDRFTMSIFITNLAFSEGNVITGLK